MSWRLASAANVSATTASVNPAAMRHGGRMRCGARHASPAPIASVTHQPTAAPASPGTTYRTKLVITPQRAGPTAKPCASAISSSLCRSATRTTTKPTAASAVSSASSNSRPGTDPGSMVINQPLGGASDLASHHALARVGAQDCYTPAHTNSCPSSDGLGHSANQRTARAVIGLSQLPSLPA